jgi:hypothetical protein
MVPYGTAGTCGNLPSCLGHCETPLSSAATSCSPAGVVKRSRSGVGHNFLHQGGWPHEQPRWPAPTTRLRKAGGLPLLRTPACAKSLLKGPAAGAAAASWQLPPAEAHLSLGSQRCRPAWAAPTRGRGGSACQLGAIGLRAAQGRKAKCMHALCRATRLYIHACGRCRYTHSGLKQLILTADEHQASTRLAAAAVSQWRWLPQLAGGRLTHLQGRGSGCGGSGT